MKLAIQSPSRHQHPSRESSGQLAMKPFKAIAAMSLNRVIGNGNQIPWHLPEDFKWFKATTTGQVIVMGRKTFESIGKPLPNRETIVLSRSAFSHPGVRTMCDLSELLAWVNNPLNRSSRREEAHTISNEASQSLLTSAATKAEGEGALGQRQVFICGGAQIYEQALPLCSELFLTLVKREVAGDTFFPKFEDNFDLVEEIRDTPEFKILRYVARAR